MATVDIENGKRINMLLEADSTSDDTYILISEKNLTRRLTFYKLRKTFCADKVDEGKDNLYYSAQAIDTKVNSIYNSIEKVQLSINNIDDRLDQVFNEFGGSVSEVQNLLDLLRVEMNEADQRIINELNDKYTELNNLINSNYTSLSTDIKNLSDRVDSIQNDLTALTNTVNSFIDRFEIGTEVPVDLETGKIYLQYFTS